MSFITNIQPEVIIHRFDTDVFDASLFTQAIQIKKSVNQPVQTMSITFNPAREGKLSDNISHAQILNYLKRKIKPQDIISVKIDNQNTEHSFLGFVDHVYESVTTMNQSTGKTLKINCSLLLPKLLMRDNIVNSPVLVTNEKIKEVLKERTKFFGWTRGLTEDGKSPFVGKPVEAVKWILENAPCTNTNLGSDINPKTFFDPKKNDFEGKSLLRFQFLEGELLFSPQLSTYSGPILNYIYSCLDQAFYELFFDTTTGEDGLAYNTMTIRPKPFSFRDYNYRKNKTVRNWLNFEDLPVIPIHSSYRLSEELGINDFELKNFFTVNFTNALIGNASSYLGKFGVQFPVVNLDSITKYGLRDLAVTSSTINMDDIIEQYNDKIGTEEPETIENITSKNEGGMLNYLIDKREKIVEWFSYPFFDSGQISVPYSQKYKLGHRLFYEDREFFDVLNDQIHRGVYYYIHSVDESFQYGSQPKTTLGLSRGLPENIASDWLNANRKKFVGINEFSQNKKASGKGMIEIEDYEDILGIDEKIFDFEEVQ